MAREGETEMEGGKIKTGEKTLFERRTERWQRESGGGGEKGKKKLSMCLYVRDGEGRIQICSFAPGTAFLSAMASLSAKCTFDVSPHMLL